MTDDEREVILRCLEGDDGAAVALVRRFEDRVLAICFRMLGHRQDAEDVAQESFLRVFRSLPRWDQNRDFTPWFFAIVGNRCRSFLTSRRRRTCVVAQLDQVPDHAPQVSGASEVAEEVALAVSRLRPAYRQAFLLFHQDELSYAEIAATLGRPQGTIKTWIYRARREIARCLIERGCVETSKYDLPSVCPAAERFA